MGGIAGGGVLPAVEHLHRQRVRRRATEVADRAAQSCPVAVAFHPEKPSILTAGTLSGQIFVWDLSHEDEPLLGRSEATALSSHQEPIAAVTWVFNLREQGHEVNCHCLPPR